MPYSAEISRTNPSCIFFVLDQSYSMNRPFGGAERNKADALTTIVNRLLYELVLRCIKEPREGPRSYFDVGVIGYGRRAQPAGSAFSGKLAGKTLVSIRELADTPVRVDDRLRKVDDGDGGLIEVKVKSPVWIDPVAENGTPTHTALTLAHTILKPWVESHLTSYPPIVIHITDGEPESDPSEPARHLRGLATNDGNVLLFNIHLSEKPATPILYPDREHDLPDDFAKQLFHMSSVLPGNMSQLAREFGYAVSAQSRGFVFNADRESLINFLNLGTQRDLH